MTIGEFWEAVAQYAMMTNASGTSPGRTKKHNKEVGGVEYSAHRFWRGCDLVYDEPLPVNDRVIIAGRLGLKMIAEGSHDHVQPMDWSAG